MNIKPLRDIDLIGTTMLENKTMLYFIKNNLLSAIESQNLEFDDIYRIIQFYEKINICYCDQMEEESRELFTRIAGVPKDRYNESDEVEE